MNQPIVELAIEIATKAHKNQMRKGMDVPYITHPFSVGMLLVRSGCSDEVIAAGILHDVVEDTPLTLDDVRQDFGDHIASIVEGCSEPDRSLSWEDRKQHTIEFLKTASSEVRLVACADKLHNVRSMALAYKEIGDALWDRFKRGEKAQAWYYRGLVESLCTEEDQEGLALFQAFEREVENLFETA